jgi:hypothetical protein
MITTLLEVDLVIHLNNANTDISKKTAYYADLMVTQLTFETISDNDKTDI